MCAGLTKSYKLPTMDSEILQATVDKQQFAVRLAAETAAFSRLLARWASLGRVGLGGFRRYSRRQQACRGLW